MMDVEKIADGVFKAVEAKISKALEPVLARLEALEAKEVPEAASIIRTILAGEELATLVNLEVTEAVSQIPAPKDGAPGEKGEPGRDGVGLAGALIDRDGNLVVTLANGEAKNLGQVVGKDGTPGKDGADGIGFESLEVSFDGENIVHEYKSASRTVTQKFPIQVMKHIGFWREGVEAKSGNLTSHAGSLWYCLNDTKSRPSYESADWILSARKGQDGRDKTEAKSEPVKLNGN
jgi:hypothetical protein